MHPKNLHTLISRTPRAQAAFRSRDDAACRRILNRSSNGELSPAEKAFGRNTTVTADDMVEVRYWFDVPRRIKKNYFAALEAADKDLPLNQRPTWDQCKATLARERAEDVD